MPVVGTMPNGDGGTRRIYAGIAGTNNDDLCLQTEDVSDLDTFTLHTTGGGFTVDITIDGTNWVQDISMTDLGATTSAPVIAGVANRLYGFAGPFKAIRVRQNGATAVAGLVMFGKKTSR